MLYLCGKFFWRILFFWHIPLDLIDQTDITDVNIQFDIHSLIAWTLHNCFSEIGLKVFISKTGMFRKFWKTFHLGCSASWVVIDCVIAATKGWFGNSRSSHNNFAKSFTLRFFSFRFQVNESRSLWPYNRVLTMHYTYCCIKLSNFLKISQELLKNWIFLRIFLLKIVTVVP